MRGSKSVSIFCTIVFTIGSVIFQSGECQYFDPELDDQVFLNNTHDRVKSEVVSTRQELADQVEIVRNATKAYIGAKIKENLFKALRTLAEKELETLSMQNRPRQPRQDEDDDDDSNNVSTTTERGLIPQLASILKAIVGSNINATKYAEAVSKLLPRPIGNQLVGVVSLLDPNQFTTTTLPPPVVVAGATGSPVNVTVLVPQYVQGSGQQQQGQQQSPGNNAAVFPAATASPVIVETQRRTPRPIGSFGTSGSSSNTNSGGDDDDEDGVRKEESDLEAEESDLESTESDSESNSDSNLEFEESDSKSRRSGRQFDFKGINPMLLINGVEALWNNFQPNETTTLYPYAKAGVTTESEDGFDDDYTTKPSRVVTVVQGVKVQAENLRKGVPDLFQGAREAYKFLEVINGFLDKWSERLQAGSVEVEDDTD